MMKRPVNLFIATVTLATLVFTIPSFAEEKITLTTYYPAPYGIYKELRADQMAVGSAYRNSSLSDGNFIVSGRVVIGRPTLIWSRELLDVSGGGIIVNLNNAVNPYTGLQNDDTILYGYGDGNPKFSINLRNYALPTFAVWDGARWNDLISFTTNNVGIGTTDPQATLHVAGSMIAGDMTIEDMKVNSVSVGSSYSSYLPPVNGMIVQGKVGIGTTNPQAVFHIDDPAGGSGLMLLTSKPNLGFVIQMQRASSSTAYYYISSALSGFRIHRGTAPWNDFVISATDGNVGIGTDMPKAKLEVNGDLKATRYMHNTPSNLGHDHRNWRGGYVKYLNPFIVQVNHAGKQTGPNTDPDSYLVCPEGKFVCGARIRNYDCDQDGGDCLTLDLKCC